MSLRTPDTVKKLQTTLHAQAKKSPSWRGYTLYDKVYRLDVLWTAYQQCRRNGGAPGVDQQTFDDIEAYGATQWLGELAQALREKTYRPAAVRRVHIPKPGQPGRTRPLGIPTLTDRVVMTAVVLVLDPIFEVDLQPEQYAYRPQRSALDAVRHVHSLLNTGYTEVVDADLSGYFDSIPHPELMKSVACRISDKAMLRLIKMWLEAPVEECDSQGRIQRTTHNRDRQHGCPQGAPISPLLSNLYMRRFVLGWKVLGHEQGLQARIVNYADDLVICCRGSAETALTALRDMMAKLKLIVNDEKTHICRIPQESFDFLGYTYGRCYTSKGRVYIGTRPAERKITHVCRTIHELTTLRWSWMEPTAQVRRLNEVLRGWGNYFYLGAASKAYRRVMQHTRKRLRQWLCKKHRVRSQRYTRYSDAWMHHELGLVNLEKQRRNFSCANA